MKLLESVIKKLISREVKKRLLKENNQKLEYPNSKDDYRRIVDANTVIRITKLLNQRLVGLECYQLGISPPSQGGDWTQGYEVYAIRKNKKPKGLILVQGNHVKEIIGQDMRPLPEKYTDIVMSWEAVYLY